MEEAVEKWRGSPLQEKGQIDYFGLLSLLDLLVEEDGKYRLKYCVRKTSIALMMAQTKYLLKKMCATDGECLREEKKSIEKLHLYNRTKDIAQDLMGMLATNTGVTLKELHEKFDVGAREL